MRNIVVITIMTCAAILSGCRRYDIGGMVVSSSKNVEARFDESMEINAAHSTDTIITVTQDRYKIYAASDFHIGETAENLGRYLRTAESDHENVCVMILGDITDQRGGHVIAADTIAGIGISKPIRYIAGNHDLYFGLWDSYKEHFGSSSYYFVIESDTACDLFVCLDSGSGTLGKKQLKWLKDLLKEKRPHYRHCVVMTHTNFFDSDLSQIPTGSFSQEETITLAGLFAKNNVDLVVNGHDHTRDISTINGVEFITLDEIKDLSEKASFLIIEIDDEISTEFYGL